MEFIIIHQDFMEEMKYEIAYQLEQEGKFEEAKQLREQSIYTRTEEDDEYLIKSIGFNQSLLFEFKKYIAENY